MKFLENKEIYDVPAGYLESVEKAFLTFKFQIVYCPIEQKLRYFNRPEESKYFELFNKFEDKSFLGE